MKRHKCLEWTLFVCAALGGLPKVLMKEGISRTLAKGKEWINSGTKQKKLVILIPNLVTIGLHFGQKCLLSEI